MSNSFSTPHSLWITNILTYKSLCPQENVPEQKHAVGFSTDYDETCWKRYWGEIFQKSEKLTFQPFNSKFEGRMFNACRT